MKFSGNDPLTITAATTSFIRANDTAITTSGSNPSFSLVCCLGPGESQRRKTAARSGGGEESEVGEAEIGAEDGVGEVAVVGAAEADSGRESHGFSGEVKSLGKGLLLHEKGKRCLDREWMGLNPSGVVCDRVSR